MEIERATAGVCWPNDTLEAEWAKYRDLGATEPWIAQIVSSLLVGSGQNSVLELGGYQGITSSWLALTLQRMGGGDLIISEPDEARNAAIAKVLSGLAIPNVVFHVERTPSPDIIHQLPNESIGFAWVDDDHGKLHVEREINALWPKMRKGGIMTFHDCWGVCDLQSVVQKYGGYSIDLPRIGPAGGIGIIQLPR